MLRPAEQRWRLGFGRAPAGRVGRCASRWSRAGSRCRARSACRARRRPASRVQLGARPLNRKWVNPHDVEKRLRDDDAARSAARGRTRMDRRAAATRACSSSQRARLADAGGAAARRRGLVRARRRAERSRVASATKPSAQWAEERELLARLAELESRARGRGARAVAALPAAVGRRDRGRPDRQRRRARVVPVTATSELRRARHDRPALRHRRRADRALGADARGHVPRAEPLRGRRLSRARHARRRRAPVQLGFLRRCSTSLRCVSAPPPTSPSAT